MKITIHEQNQKFKQEIETKIRNLIKKKKKDKTEDVELKKIKDRTENQERNSTDLIMKKKRMRIQMEII